MIKSSEIAGSVYALPKILAIIYAIPLCIIYNIFCDVLDAGTECGVSLGPLEVEVCLHVLCLVLVPAPRLHGQQLALVEQG